MQFTRLHSIIIISLVLLCLAGLSFIQMNWLKGAMVIREERIEEQIHQAMEQIQETLNQQLVAQSTISKTSWDSSSDALRPLQVMVDQAIDSILRINHLSMPFEYGLSSCKSKQYGWFSKPELEAEIREGYQAQLSNCIFFNQKKKSDHLHFYAIFPQQEQLIFKQMAAAIGSSVLFILLLMLIFIYMLSTIFRQKKLSEMKTDFINNLSHEFKTPIASIALAAKTLKKLDTVHQSEKAMNYLQLINQEGKRLENHIDKVLQMASIDAGTVQLDQQQIAPNTIIEKVISSLNIMLEKKNGQLHLELLEAPHNIQADSMHFFNIVYNLVDNAIKYNEGQPVIHIRSRITDSGWQLSVQDNGIGMNMAVQKQVFQRFYRQHADDIHDVKGFGLGLTYVKRMMDAHQGQVHITSQVNQGSTFQLTFPNYYFEQYV